MRRLFFTLIALALLGCKSNDTRGYVVGKEYIPEHTEKTVLLMGKMFYTKEVIVPSQWRVWVADSCCVRIVNVDSLTFQGIKHGEFRIFR